MISEHITEEHVPSPTRPPRAVAIYAFRPQDGDDPHAVSGIPAALAASGIEVVAVDLRAASPWDIASATGHEVSELKATVRAAGDDGVPLVLIGHSAAGPVALAAAAHLADLSAVVTIGSPAAEASVRNTVPLLILHAPTDGVVPISDASQIFEAAHHPKSLVALDGVDHAVSTPEDARRVAALITAWLDLHLPSPAPSPGVEGEVVVTDAGTYTQRVTAGRHVLTADEPSSVGGADAGPNPYDLLLAALGTCTSITVRMFANRKGMPLHRTTVRLRHDRVHAKDCAQDSEDATLTRIHREITLDGPLTEDDRARLFQIADRCPVHRTLSARTVIETTRTPTLG